jgi:hypothetical protein
MFNIVTTMFNIVEKYINGRSVYKFNTVEKLHKWEQYRQSHILVSLELASVKW